MPPIRSAVSLTARWSENFSPPLNTMCSRKWAIPFSSGRSVRAPASKATSTVTARVPGIRRRTSGRPVASVVCWTSIIDLHGSERDLGILRRVKRLVFGLVLVLLFAGVCGAASASPIPQGSTSAPAFVGSPAVQQPLFAPLPPQNPFMAPNEKSELHVDGYQTDTNALPGPLG